MPRTIDGLKTASLRSSTPEYNLQYSSFSAVLDFLDKYNTTEGKRVRVMLTPSLFLPESNDKYEIVEFWGPYINWDEKHDVLIFGIVNTPRGKPIPKDSRNYSAFLIEREGYAAHVAEKAKICKSNPCYTRVMELPNGGEILVLSR